MVSSILYAYLENLQFLFCIFCVLIIIAMVALGIRRYTNDIDKDDWLYVMFWLTPSLVIFANLLCVPDIEHVKKINETLNPVEIKNESIPNVSPAFSIECNGLRTK